MLELDLMK